MPHKLLTYKGNCGSLYDSTRKTGAQAKSLIYMAILNRSL